MVAVVLTSVAVEGDILAGPPNDRDSGGTGGRGPERGIVVRANVTGHRGVGELESVDVDAIIVVALASVIF